MQQAMTTRARWAFETLTQAMTRSDGTMMSREPKIRYLVEELTGLVEKAARPEDYPECEYPDDFVYEHPDDSDLWQQLFTLAALKDADFATCLCFIRANGAILVPDAQYGWVIRPVIGGRGYQSREDYATAARSLAPWKDELRTLLKGLKDGKESAQLALF